MDLQIAMWRTQQKLKIGGSCQNFFFVSVKNGDWLRSKFTLVITALIPIAILIGMIYWFATKGASLIETPVVPVEKLDFERIILHPEEIIVYVRNTGPTEVTIAQVTVNEALWEA